METVETIRSYPGIPGLNPAMALHFHKNRQK